MVSQNQKEFPEIDHFILGEAENIIGDLLDDLADGKAERIYKNPDYPDIKKNTET